MLTPNFRTLSVDEFININESKQEDSTQLIYTLEEMITLRILEWMNSEGKVTKKSLLEQLNVVLTEFASEVEAESSIEEWIEHSGDLFNINVVANESEGKNEDIFELSQYGKDIVEDYLLEKTDIDSIHTVENFKTNK